MIDYNGSCEAVIGTDLNNGDHMIEHTKGAKTQLGDVTCITGKGIDFFRMATISMGLRSEARGMRLTRGVSCYALAKREYGLKGNLASVTAQFNALLEQAKQQQQHVMRDPKTGETTEL